jgi:hypothetical protein
MSTFLFQIHIALGISYYKLFPTSELIIRSWYLDDEQIAFWKKFYLSGLWEFFISNNIVPKGLLNFKNRVKPSQSALSGGSRTLLLPWQGEAGRGSSLLLFWWWKDSIVSYNLIKDTDFDLFVFWKLDKIKEETSKIIGKAPLLVKRRISDNLFRLNELWYYNGHVPITWIIAFVTVFYAYLYWYRNIILSNEKSSSEENLAWKWMKINHQYSKSFEFEKNISEYIKKYLSPDIKYFSLLRWMYEFKIAEIFSKQTDFFQSFSSCNKNFVIQWERQKNNWCNRCPKCVFVFLILSNFLDIEELKKIFWENLFEKYDLEDIFGELIGVKKHKPFECVWTLEESIFSFYNAVEEYSSSCFYILERFKDNVLNKEESFHKKKVEDKLLKMYDDDIIPKEFKDLLRKKPNEA